MSRLGNLRKIFTEVGASMIYGFIKGYLDDKLRPEIEQLRIKSYLEKGILL